MSLIKPRRNSQPATASKSPFAKNKTSVFETFTIAPAPSRDYHGLQLYLDHFSWLRWRVSHGPYLLPQQRNIVLKDFMKDSALQNEMAYIFGPYVANLIVHVAKGYWNLSIMPTMVLLRVAGYLSVQDILSLAQVNKRLSKECSRNEIWEPICKDQWKILLHDDADRAANVGWKQVYLEKMMPSNYLSRATFLTNLVKSAKQKSSIQFRDSVLNNYLDREKSRLSSSKSNIILIGSEGIRTASSTARSTSSHLLKSGKAYADAGKSTDRSTITGKSKTTNRKSSPSVEADNFRRTSTIYYEGHSVKKLPFTPSINPYNKFYPTEMFNTINATQKPLRAIEENHRTSRPMSTMKTRSNKPQSTVKKPSTANSIRSFSKPNESIQSFRVKSGKVPRPT